MKIKDNAMDSAQPSSQPRLLTDSQYAKCLSTTLAYLKQHGSIRNRQLRAETGITYDQAISFFKRATDELHVHRRGTSGGTHYVRGADDDLR